MSISTPRYTTTVTIEHDPIEHQTVAYFDWPQTQVGTTYTIDVTHHTSLALDEHFPVRPVKLTTDQPTDSIGEIGVIEELFGEEFGQAIQTAPRLGFLAFELCLSRPNRLAIARLQAHSPSSSRTIKHACRAMIDGHNEQS